MTSAGRLFSRFTCLRKSISSTATGNCSLPASGGGVPIRNCGSPAVQAVVQTSAQRGQPVTEGERHRRGRWVVDGHADLENHRANPWLRLDVGRPGRGELTPFVGRVVQPGEGHLKQGVPAGGQIVNLALCLRSTSNGLT